MHDDRAHAFLEAVSSNLNLEAAVTISFRRIKMLEGWDALMAAASVPEYPRQPAAEKLRARPEQPGQLDFFSYQFELSEQRLNEERQKAARIANEMLIKSPEGVMVMELLRTFPPSRERKRVLERLELGLDEYRANIPGGRNRGELAAEAWAIVQAGRALVAGRENNFSRKVRGLMNSFEASYSR